MNHSKGKEEVARLNLTWSQEPRWRGIKRNYSAQEVVDLRPSIAIEHTLATVGAKRLWHLLHTDPYIVALGALNGSQAVQAARAGLKSIYLSGWQVAADG